jgi:hypothetical protein
MDRPDTTNNPTPPANAATTLSPQASVAPANHPPRPGIWLHLSKSWLMVVAALLLAPWAVVGLVVSNRPSSPELVKQAGASSTIAATAAAGQLGPWGELACTPITIEPPEEFIAGDSIAATATRWVFRAATKDSVGHLLERAGLNETQRAAFLASAAPDAGDNTLVLLPPEELVASLSPAARATIYAVLSEDPENACQADPFRYRAEAVDEWLSHSEIPGDVATKIKSLLYPCGTMLMFSDVPLVLSHLPTPHERVEVVKTLSRKSALLVTLHVRPDANTDELATYWGKGGRARDLKPLLEGLARMPDGGRIGIAYLLPPFARKRLYTYPYSGDDSYLGDCHWSSLNFFNDPPDNRLRETSFVKKSLDTDYYPISSSFAYGDVIMLTKPDAGAIHSGVYIADDIVFTKNGGSPTSPYMLMKLQDMTSFYAASGELQLHVFRPKKL